jgi:hypothetical protein
VEECPETLAFVSEPVLASLANVFAADEQRQLMEATAMNHHHHHQNLGNQQVVGGKANFVKEYDMLDIELKYGLLQCTEALSFLHNSCQLMHRNVCPSSIIITKKGTWKLFGFEFIGELMYTFTPYLQHLSCFNFPRRTRDASFQYSNQTCKFTPSSYYIMNLMYASNINIREQYKLISTI